MSMHVCIYDACVYINEWVYMHVFAYAGMYACIYEWICMYAFVCLCMQVFFDVHACMFAFIQQKWDNVIFIIKQVSML